MTNYAKKQDRQERKDRCYVLPPGEPVIMCTPFERTFGYRKEITKKEFEELYCQNPTPIKDDKK